MLSIFGGLGARRLSGDGTSIKDEDWGYVQVRENANMFWWFYGAENEAQRENLPLILWLQGGPGASGAGYGNFMEIGPIDIEMHKRETAWTKVANLLFIDNPVGAGFSYVTEDSAYTTNVTGIAEDLFTVFSSFMSKYSVFSNTPFYIFCESYGGKMTPVFADRLYQGQKHGEIKSNLRGVALGDSWVSAVDSVLTWGPFLYQYNLLDEKDLNTLEDDEKPLSNVKDEITLLEALSATGLRAIRYALEIQDLSKLIANDLSKEAVKTIERNITHNNVGKLVKSSLSDAR